MVHARQCLSTFNVSTFNFPSKHFNDHFIALHYNIHEENGMALPSYSSNLMPSNFFLWRYLKNLVCYQTPQTIAELKQYICTACGTISTDMFARLPGYFCLGPCHINGGYFENIVQFLFLRINSKDIDQNTNDKYLPPPLPKKSC